MSIRWIDLLKLSFDALHYHKMRSLMAMMGIIFSLSAFITITIVGLNAKSLIFDEIKTFGLNTVWVQKKSIPQPQQEPSILSRKIPIHSIPQHMPNITHLSPIIHTIEWVQTDQKTLKAQVLYANTDWTHIEQNTLKWGRYFTHPDQIAQNPVCLLGSEAASTLFGQKNPVGSSLKIGAHTAIVIGVLSPKDRPILNQLGLQSNNPNIRIILPLSFGIHQHGPYADYIQFATSHAQLAQACGESMIQKLKQLNPEKSEYAIIAMHQYIEATNNILRYVSLLVSISLGITMIVGGIGVANTMTLTVYERSKEVGIRRAIGASKTTIFLQFMIESLLISLGAGIIGIIIGITLLMGVEQFLKIPLSLSTTPIYIGILLSVSIGLIAGTYPAQLAAKRPPAQAIREYS